MKLNRLFSNLAAMVWMFGLPAAGLANEPPIEAIDTNEPGSADFAPEVNENTMLPADDVGAVSEIYARGPIARQCDCQRCSTQRASWWSRYKSRKQEKYWGYPEEFEEPPLGMFSSQIMNAQIARGEKARLTLYDCDFVNGTDSLNPHGYKKMSQLAQLAMMRGEVITLQSVNQSLDTARLKNVVTAGANFGLEPSQFVVGQPIAGGLNGEEAMIHRQTLLENTERYGTRQFNFGVISGSGGR